MIDFSPYFCSSHIAAVHPAFPFLKSIFSMDSIRSLWSLLTCYASSGATTLFISPDSSPDKGPDVDSPLTRKSNRQRMTKTYNVSKSPATLQLRRSPRSAKHGSIPRQCHEYIDEATQQRCPNFENYRGIRLAECATQGSGNHRGFGNAYTVCEPCRTRVMSRRSPIA